MDLSGIRIPKIYNEKLINHKWLTIRETMIYSHMPHEVPHNHIILSEVLFLFRGI